MRLAIPFFVLCLVCISQVDAGSKVTIKHAPLAAAIDGLPGQTDSFFWCAVAKAATTGPPATSLGLYQGQGPKGKKHWFVYQTPAANDHTRDRKILSSEHIHLISRSPSPGWVVTPKSRQNKKDVFARINFIFYSFSSFSYAEQRDQEMATTNMEVENAKKKVHGAKLKRKEWNPTDLERSAFDSVINKLNAAAWMKQWMAAPTVDGSSVEIDIADYTFNTETQSRKTIRAHNGAPLVAPTQFTVDC